LGFNLSKTGVSASVKNKAGTFNFLKPQYSFFKFVGVQFRGKTAAQLQVIYMLIMAAVLFVWDILVGFVRGLRLQ